MRYSSSPFLYLKNKSSRKTSLSVNLWKFHWHSPDLHQSCCFENGILMFVLQSEIWNLKPQQPIYFLTHSFPVPLRFPGLFLVFGQRYIELGLFLSNCFLFVHILSVYIQLFSSLLCFYFSNFKVIFYCLALMGAPRLDVFELGILESSAQFLIFVPTLCSIWFLFYINE